MVEVVDAIRGRAQILAVEVAARGGAFPIAYIVERISKLLARHRRPIRPGATCSDQFVAVIVAVAPCRSILDQRLRPPVQGVITVGGYGHRCLLPGFQFFEFSVSQTQFFHRIH